MLPESVLHKKKKKKGLAVRQPFFVLFESISVCRASNSKSLALQIFIYK